ncbi:MAG: spore cortex biosynthesis protein YabQ [Clostridia bacterium]|nr:spore cortex biosynthesis protein YabQ [Clostridia bacterium]
MGYRYDQIYSFIAYSVILGFSFGVLYDIFRIIRMSVCVPGIISAKEKNKSNKNGFIVNVIVFVCDILFFILAACISAIFVFHANNGNIRIIAMIGSLAGFAVYYNTVGRLVTLISHFIIKSIYYLIRFIIKRILLPFVSLIFGVLRHFISKTSFLCDSLYTKRCIRKRISWAKRGFKQKMKRKDVEL